MVDILAELEADAVGELTRRLARFDSPAQVVDWLEGLGVECTPEDVQAARSDPAIAGAIQQAREQWAMDWGDVAFAHAKVRVLRLSQLAMHTDPRVALQALKAIREEMERQVVPISLEQQIANFDRLLGLERGQEVEADD